MIRELENMIDEDVYDYLTPANPIQSQTRAPSRYLVQGSEWAHMSAGYVVVLRMFGPGVKNPAYGEAASLEEAAEKAVRHATGHMGRIELNVQRCDSWYEAKVKVKAPLRNGLEFTGSASANDQAHAVALAFAHAFNARNEHYSCASRK